jgi:AraC-like DNA-binding protein
MIALIGLLAPRGTPVGTVALDVLPSPPAFSYSGFAVHCVCEAEVADTIDWYRQVLAGRRAVPLGLVCRPNHCARLLAQFEHPLNFLISPFDLVAGGLPATLLDEIRSASIEGRLLEEIIAHHGDAAKPMASTIRTLIYRAVRGGSVASVARDLGVSSRTVRRRLRKVGLSPGSLKQKLRLRAYELRLELGMSRNAALAAGGWNDHGQRRKCARRFHRSVRC